jgi:hypothetical protein
MISSPCHSLGRWGLCLSAVLIVCLAPAAVRGEELTLRNECRAPVVVYTSYVVRGKMFRNKPYLLKPGQSTPKIKLLADMVVSINDGKVPNRVLFQGAVRATTTKLYYGIVLDTRKPGKVTVVRRTPPR